MAVLAPVYFPILLQRFVESLILRQMSFAFGEFIGHNQTVIIEDPHGSILDAQDKILFYMGVGKNNIAVAFKTDGEVFVNYAVDPPGRVKRNRRRRLQMGQLTLVSTLLRGLFHEPSGL
jgi:hypothetical protein